MLNTHDEWKIIFSQLVIVWFIGGTMVAISIIADITRAKIASFGSPLPKHHHIQLLSTLHRCTLFLCLVCFPLSFSRLLVFK